ncbi:hypothetical protein [Blattabacterium cuenoti]|uniref:hypothetical protein n=1 Tax=Blattabacterium cuenoti TaxID=1653831 RepID=UPI00163D0FBC|nr:hypothetical protein [Blattabacterium cuenoti]
MKTNRRRIIQKIFIKTNLLYKEKGLLKFSIYSPLIKEDSYYTLFPKGLDLFIYENNKNKYTYIHANWVKSRNKIFYHIKGNIRIINDQGYLLKTKEIFWNRKQKKIFNDKYTMIYNPKNGTKLYAINGIEASENFRSIKLKNISGTLSI